MAGVRTPAERPQDLQAVAAGEHPVEHEQIVDAVEA